MMTDQSKATVLVVDDNAMARRVAVNVFKMLGCIVLEAEDGPSALAQIAGHPQVVLLFSDLGIPGIGGAELAVKAQAIRPGLKIVLTSGGAGEAALPSDAVFLRKPWRIAELKALLGAFTGSSGKPA